MTQQEIIKSLIKHSGLNQKKFAEKHKMHPVYLNSVVKGKKEYRRATLGLIAFDEGFSLEITYKIEKL